VSSFRVVVEAAFYMDKYMKIRLFKKKKQARKQCCIQLPGSSLSLCSRMLKNCPSQSRFPKGRLVAVSKDPWRLAPPKNILKLSQKTFGG
jgi:hypothetical protein